MQCRNLQESERKNMCMAITYTTKNHYFGRNLDLECSFGEAVAVTPRNYGFRFRKVKCLKHHYAMIGMAVMADGYPLYFDATNEYGVSMAGLNFPDNAYYPSESKGLDNIAPFEFIPWILGQCTSVEGALTLLEDINLVNVDFSEEMPLSPLHWIISDKECSITVEPMEGGLRIFDNPVGVLTNNPPFDYQMFNLNRYMGLSPKPPENRFSDKLILKKYSRGMGAIGLPGDMSSTSRFVKGVFTKMNSVSGDSEAESVSQFFHILASAEQQRGCVEVGNGEFEHTVYSSCCNTDRGIYYYRTYDNSQIYGIDMFSENLDGDAVSVFPLKKDPEFTILNG